MQQIRAEKNLSFIEPRKLLVAEQQQSSQTTLESVVSFEFIISSLKPLVIALQETKIGNKHNISFQNYSLYNCPGAETNGVYHGGSALIINKTIPHKLLNIQTNLQATAVRVTFFKVITVCSVYLPPFQRWDIKDLEELYSQLPPPAILMGDFNAHSQT